MAKVAVGMFRLSNYSRIMGASHEILGIFAIVFG
jgi:hypothetical protein